MAHLPEPPVNGPESGPTVCRICDRPITRRPQGLWYHTTNDDG